MNIGMTEPSVGGYNWRQHQADLRRHLKEIGEQAALILRAPSTAQERAAQICVKVMAAYEAADALREIEGGNDA